MAIYSHPEYYPPTLSAVENLAPLYDRIYILHRNTPGFDWSYPANVELLGFKKQYSVSELERAGFFRKLIWYLAFSLKLFSLINRYKPVTILFYDYQVLLSYRLVYLFSKKPRILWYHNHDVAEKQYLRKFSLSWWSWKSEAWIFPKLQIFSLPAIERKQYFPMDLFKGKFFFLPNYPSRLIYDSTGRKAIKDDEIYKILFQGSIGPLHGLEEIIPLLKEKLEGRELRLIIKGFIQPSYFSDLKKIASVHGVADKLIYIGPTDYRQVIENGKNCHIGIGIHKKEDVMNKTLGTASNKIYEYAAMGLPVVLYDNTHFRQTLGKFTWAFFTNSSATSISNCFTKIILNYNDFSSQATNDFHKYLSFELFFDPVKYFLQDEK